MTLPGLWIGLIVFVVVMMALDLGVFHRKAHAISLREASLWTCIWVALALLFNVLIYLFWPEGEGNVLSRKAAAGYFMMGYLIEWSLSMDNVFVFAVIFNYFGVRREHQHRVLFWGIIGAVVLRLIFVLLGAELLRRFYWFMYLFGLFLVYTGIKLMFHKSEEVNPERNLVLRYARRWLPIDKSYHDEHFVVLLEGKRKFTPLFLVLLVIETTDVLFAVDSVPAIFGIFAHPSEADVFIVFSSNVFAILGLRALYFLLAGVMGKFKYLGIGLAVILVGIGLKMLATDILEHWEVPHDALMIGSLFFIAGVLGISIIASILSSQEAQPTS